MIAAEIIRRKRNGERLSRADLSEFIQGIQHGTVADSQLAAFAMAVYFQGMHAQECADLTHAMRDSGRVLDWHQILGDAPVIDKHSTGGVGDNVSLMLAPMLAACGAFVPMISGRGLGFTGGTLDKLDSIPGYQSQISIERLTHIVQQTGCAIVGASNELAPADAALYAIRDVTATVDCEALIVSSILAKKLAGGLDALILDVKTGNGATAPDYPQSQSLANSLVETAKSTGLHCQALITDMQQPLATAAGNAIEVRDALNYLHSNSKNARQHEVIMGLGARLLNMTELADSLDAAQTMLETVLRDGSAAERFGQMVHAAGGPSDLIDKPNHYLQVSGCTRAVLPREAGIVHQIDTRALGLAVVALGGGRTRPDSALDYSTGLSEIATIGESVDNERPFAVVHAHDATQLDQIYEAVQSAFVVTPVGAPESSVVIGESVVIEVVD